MPVILLLSQNALIVLTLVSFLAKAYARSIRYEEAWRRSERRYENVLQYILYLFHDLSHIKRDVMNHKVLQPRDLPAPKCVDALIAFCEGLVRGFSVMFQGHPVTFHAAIKVVVENDNVIVIARDRRMGTTDAHKVDNRQLHLITNNTALVELLSRKTTVFACDNLKERAARKEFKNTSPDWGSRYTATMVVPIRRNHVDAVNENIFELVGYIGVDCLVPEGLQHIFCDANGVGREDFQNFMLGYADAAFGIIKRGKIIGDTRTEAPHKEYVIDQDNFRFAWQLHQDFLERFH